MYTDKKVAGQPFWGHLHKFLSSFAVQGQNDMNDLLGLVKVRWVFGCVGGWSGGVGAWRGERWRNSSS